jgi:endonuclease YncB( thermonuclease family)
MCEDLTMPLTRRAVTAASLTAPLIARVQVPRRVRVLLNIGLSGRTVARVECDCADASAEQAVIAWVFDRYVTDRGLYAVQDEARAARRGLWSEGQPLAPWQWRRRTD